MGMLVMVLTSAVVFVRCVNLKGTNPDGGDTFVAVTDITGGPETATVGMPLTLTATVAPADATDQTIVWSVKGRGATGAEITGSSLSAAANGYAVVTGTIANGKAEGTPFTRDFIIQVNRFVTVAEFVNWTAVAEVGEPLALNNRFWVNPVNASDRTITWTLKDAGNTGATITGNVLTATAMGDAIITGTVANGLGPGMPFTADRTITVKGPLVVHGDFVIRDIQGGVELVTYLGNEANVIIPGNLGITVLLSPFMHHTLTSVVVPEGVTEIGEPFYECSALESVTLPQSLRTIGWGLKYSLVSITVKALTPPAVEGNLISTPPTSEPCLAHIYVPAASVEAYKNADVWKEYADLITAIP
jgi:hypothetical protein